MGTLQLFYHYPPEIISRNEKITHSYIFKELQLGVLNTRQDAGIFFQS
jgi:hypothetical protein